MLRVILTKFFSIAAMPTTNSLYVTFKVTLKCNLACQYCYGRDNHAQGNQMTEEEILKGLRFVYSYALLVHARRLTVCWHGGEPFLLLDKLPPLLDEANAWFEQSGIKVNHVIQTNATLLHPETYGTIKRYFNGFIGVSLDLFSSFRTFPNGKVSTDVAVRNIDNALAAGIRCGVINLITKDNIGKINELYDFYKQRHISVRLARVFPISGDDTLSSPMYVTDEEFANALIQYFDLWANDSHPADNSDIVKLVADLLLGFPSICLREANCHQRYMALSPGGDIFTCAEFDVPESVIGNFLTQSPEAFAQSDQRERLAAKAPVPKECHECRYGPTCHGGCFRERFMLGYPYRCRSNKLYWDHVVQWIEDKGGSLYLLKEKPLAEKQTILDRLFKRPL